MTGFALTTKLAWELMIRQAIHRYALGLIGLQELGETIERWTIRAERESTWIKGWFT